MKNPFPIVALIMSGLATTAAAQSLEDVSVEAGLSTLGLYVAPKIEIAPSITARAPLYFGSVSDTFDVDGNDVAGKLTSNSVALMADYALGGAGFRLSAGVSFGGYELQGRSTNLTIEGNRYTGNFTAEVKQKREVAPVLSIGYTRPLGDKWGIVAELGARITSFEISTTGQELITSPTERAQFNADLAQANRDLSDVKLLPFVTLGVSYNF